MKMDNAPTMHDLMTVLAKRHAVGNIVPQFDVILPGLYVVGVYLVACAAFLAGVIIPAIDRPHPLLILPAASLFGSGLAGRLALALAGTDALGLFWTQNAP